MNRNLRQERWISVVYLAPPTTLVVLGVCVFGVKVLANTNCMVVVLRECVIGVKVSANTNCMVAGSLKNAYNTVWVTFQLTHISYSH